jgi:hypothetical protein
MPAQIWRLNGLIGVVHKARSQVAFVGLGCMQAFIQDCFVCFSAAKVKC